MEKLDRRNNRLMINSVQIGNSASIYQVSDNAWEEDLGYLKIKYYYENGKDLIIEWESLD